MSSRDFTIYLAETGQIVNSGSVFGAEDMLDAQVQANLDTYGADTHGVVNGPADKATQYVAVLGDERIIAERPQLIVFVEDDKTTIQAGGEDYTTLTGLPNPCEIIIDDPDPDVETQVVEVSGGGFIFEAENPGVYTVEVRRWPFRPFKIEFTAI